MGEQCSLLIPYLVGVPSHRNLPLKSAQVRVYISSDVATFIVIQINVTQYVDHFESKQLRHFGGYFKTLYFKLCRSVWKQSSLFVLTDKEVSLWILRPHSETANSLTWPTLKQRLMRHSKLAMCSETSALTQTRCPFQASTIRYTINL